ncbi:hypothetical protein EXS70_04200 [Candidatus Peribacteria bacterium]|nr:hypothetical protein [Candidatus Peribacteria bacterium]
MNTGFSIRAIDHRQRGDDPLGAGILTRRTNSPISGAGIRARLGGFAIRVWASMLYLTKGVRRKQQQWGWKRSILLVVVAGFTLFASYALFLWLTLPSIDEQSLLAASQSTVITDRNGVELYRVFDEEDRTIIPGSDIPKTMKQAIIAIEDRRYYDRGCIDIRALARAVLSMGRAGGASTITRQLARNALNLQRENIVSRKMKELILGCQLESRYDKEQLLELYLNWIPFGQNAYGLQQASSRYFGKEAKKLTLAESAVLAGLPQLPSYFSPYGRHVHTTVNDRIQKGIEDGTITSTDQIDDDDVSIGLLGNLIGTGAVMNKKGKSPSAAVQAAGSGHYLYVGGRADQVLRSMQDEGFITDAQRQQAVKELQTIAFKQIRENIRAPHFVLWAKEQVEALLGSTEQSNVLEQGGITIQTTLDWTLQEAAESVIAAHKDDIKNRFMADNIALVSVDPQTREILAYVGNTDYLDATSEGKIDMALVPRQPGSSFKPFIYAAAFGNGYGPSTVIYDVPTKFGEYAPQNFEGSFWGLTSARRALGGSRNIPAVKAYFLGGQENDILTLVEKMGVPSPKAQKPTRGYGAALAIGAAEVPLTEMVQGYATLADNGMVKPMSGILKVTDNHGAILFSMDDSAARTLSQAEPRGARNAEQALDPRIAYEVTSILSDVGARPNEYWKNILSVPGTQAAAKTGTSNKCLERETGKDINPETAACKKRRPDNVWTIGYTPAIVTGVWVGNATNDVLSEKADGLTVAAPIWHDFMAKAQKILKPAVTAFTMPDGIVQAQISLLSGQLPTECTPVALRRSDIFLTENAPSKEDPACVTLMVDRVTGLLASDSCPVEARTERSFLVPYNVAGADFPQWDTDVMKWAKAQAMENPHATNAAFLAAGTGSTISLFIAGSGGILPLPIAPTEKCDIALTPGRTVKPTLQIFFPQQDETVSYPQFLPRIQYTVGSRVHSIEYAIDGKVVNTVLSPPYSPPLRVPKSISKEGTHTLRVTLTDQYFNVITDEVSVRFSQDRSGPDIRLTSPASGTEFTAGSSLTMRADSGDAGGGVKYVEFYLDTLLLSRDASIPYELTYPLKVTPGQHTVKAVATDLAGNSAEDEVTINVR